MTLAEYRSGRKKSQRAFHASTRQPHATSSARSPGQRSAGNDRNRRDGPRGSFRYLPSRVPHRWRRRDVLRQLHARQQPGPFASYPWLRLPPAADLHADPHRRIERRHGPTLFRRDPHLFAPAVPLVPLRPRTAPAAPRLATADPLGDPPHRVDRPGPARQTDDLNAPRPRRGPT